jgi:hypothetical protein
MTLDLSGQPDGIYLIRASGKGKATTLRVIKH